MAMNPNPTNHDGTELPGDKALPMNNVPNHELPAGDAEATSNEFQNIGEFEHFLAIAVEGYADAMETPLAEISTFREAGVLTSDHGLVLRIGKAEFQVTIARSR